MNMEEKMAEIIKRRKPETASTNDIRVVNGTAAAGQAKTGK